MYNKIISHFVTKRGNLLSTNPIQWWKFSCGGDQPAPLPSTSANRHVVGNFCSVGILKTSKYTEISKKSYWSEYWDVK